MPITWDATKAEANEQKHGVSFEEAKTVFDDSLVEFSSDLEHGEARTVALGMSSYARVLYVVHVELDEDTIRIISARKANRHERKRYEEG